MHESAHDGPVFVGVLQMNAHTAAGAEPDGCRGDGLSRLVQGGLDGLAVVSHRRESGTAVEHEVVTDVQDARRFTRQC